MCRWNVWFSKSKARRLKMSERNGCEGVWRKEIRKEERRWK
jgi:hypothetical protein